MGLDKKKRLLSKSQINTFRQCPYRWSLQYINKLPQGTPGPALARGVKIHSDLENFYRNIDLTKADIPEIIPRKGMEEIPNFLEFEKKRIKTCLNKEGKFDLKYFKPLFQELKVYNPEWAVRGFIDAVYINANDDGIIVIDWKSGGYYANKLDDYRFELAIYKYLLETGGHINGNKVKYWAIYFVDKDKLFFEEAEDKYMDIMFEKVQKAREGMESGDYPKQRSFFCRWCPYVDKCSPWRDVIK